MRSLRVSSRSRRTTIPDIDRTAAKLTAAAERLRALAFGVTKEAAVHPGKPPVGPSSWSRTAHVTLAASVSRDCPPGPPISVAICCMRGAAAHRGQRSGLTRNVHDAAPLIPSHQRDGAAAAAPGSEQVSLEGLSHDGEGGG